LLRRWQQRIRESDSTASRDAAIGVALVWTLEQGLGVDWTPEVATAWTDAYERLRLAVAAVSATLGSRRSSTSSYNGGCWACRPSVIWTRRNATISRQRQLLLLRSPGIFISKRQVGRLLIGDQDGFLAEARDVLRASRWTTPAPATEP
jgi:hypothetical protein